MTRKVGEPVHERFTGKFSIRRRFSSLCRMTIPAPWPCEPGFTPVTISGLRARHEGRCRPTHEFALPAFFAGYDYEIAK
jgi:hypothetical protein